jgi:hypothetical protein
VWPAQKWLRGNSELETVDTGCAACLYSDAIGMDVGIVNESANFLFSIKVRLHSGLTKGMAFTITGDAL